MRKLLFFILLFISAISFSQAPQFLNYQGIARDASGSVVTSNIGIKFEILQGSTPVYTEEQSVTPSAAGVFTAAIGNGINQVGVFSSINWATGPYSIRVSIDPTGGTSYSTVGTSQLLSVPYALYAEKAGNTQTVNITGPNVTGTYPNFTINPPGALTASTGISITGGTITNTAPNQTVNITGPNVIGAYPDYTITPAALTASTGISITGGTITNTAMDQTVTITGAIGTYPNFTITPTPATSITATGSSILVSGTGPGFTIVPQPSLTIVGNQLSITDGNTVTLPTGTTYTSGAGIAFTSGTVVTNTAMDQTVVISNGTNVTVNSAYPNFTINATPSLSIGSGSISITGGNSVALPSAPAQTSVTAGTNMVVNGSAPSYTVVSPTYSLNFSNSSTGVLTNGISNTSVSLPQPTLTISGTNSNVISAGSNSITIPHYTAGNGLTLAGTAPNYTLGTVMTGTSAPWSTLGNTGTNPGVNFLGTTDAQDLVFRTSNSQRMRLFNATGNLGIGNVGIATELLQVETGSNTAVSILSGTNSSLFFGNAGNHFAGSIKYDNLNGTMSFGTSSVSDRIFIDPSGRVAIGNNFTVSELDVNGSLRLQGSRLFLGGVGGINSGYTGIYEQGGDLKFAVFESLAAPNPPFAAGGNSRDGMIIKNGSGFVGIGTNGPLNQLHVASSTSTYIKVESTSSTVPNGIMFKNPNREWNIINYAAGSDRISFYDATSGQERFVIDGPTGNVGIGTNNPQGKLDVSGGLSIFRPNSSDLTKMLVQDNIGTAMRLYTDAVPGTPYDLILGTYPNGHLNQIFLKQSNAFVGIRNTNPITPLDVEGQTHTDSIRISGPGTLNVGSVLVSRDAAGNAKWAPNIGFKGAFVPSTPVTISTTTLSNVGNTLGGYTSSTIYNNGGGFSFAASGARYQVPENGVYFLEASVMVAINPSATGNNYCVLEIYNSTTATVLDRCMQSNPDTGNTMNTVLHCATPYPLNKNDIIVLRVTGSTATSGTISNAFPGTDKMNSFSGFLIR